MAVADTIHAVRFYEEDEALCRIVGGFLAKGLAADGPAVVIATPAHGEGIVRELSAQDFDVERLRRSGELAVLDADDTLSRVQQERHAEAIRLEVPWNQLARTHRFWLLCAYRVGQFFKEAVVGDLSRICHHHSHVVTDAGRVMAIAP